MNKKKICIDCRMINNSGIGSYLKNLLPRIIDQMSECFFYLLGDQDMILNFITVDKGNATIVEWNAPIFSMREQCEFPFKIPYNIDLFWAPQFNIPLTFQGKLLVTIHDVIHLAMPKIVGGFHKYLFARFLLKSVKHKANYILCVSDFTKTEVERYLSVKEKIEITYLGVDDSWKNTKKSTTPPHQNPYLLFVGNVKPNKNLLTLLKAFNLVRSSIHHDLIIVGKKEGFITGDQSLKEEYNKSKDRIFFTNYISDELLRQYYVYADIFIFPSLYEGFGLPLLEAMASKVPVISSCKASLREVGGDAALYFNPLSSIELSEKIYGLIINDDLKTDLIYKGLERIKLFQWDICAHKTVEVIKECLKEER